MYFFKKIIFGISAAMSLLALGSVAHAADGSWTNVGTAPFSAGTATNISFVFSSTGTPYVAYQDGANGYEATVMQYNGSSWEAMGSAGFTTNTPAYESLALSPTDTLYLATIDNDDTVIVHRFDGSSWTRLGTVGQARHGLGSNNLLAVAVNVSGTPYVAYADNNHSGAVTVAQYNGSSWVVVGSAGELGSLANYVSLAFAANSTTPYVAYTDYALDDKVVVQKYTGAWSLVGSAGFSDGSVDRLMLTFDQNGSPYVAYGDVAHSDKATVMKYSGSSWTALGSVGFSPQSTDFLTVAIDANNVPYVAYRNEDSSSAANVMRYIRNSWSAVGSTDFTGELTGIVVAINPANQLPYLALADNSYNASAMKFAPPTPSAPTGFSASVSNTDVSLSWTNSTSSYFSSVTIRQSTSTFPTSTSDGTAVTSSLSGTSFVDTGLANGTYYYSIFTTDDFASTSIAATTTAVTVYQALDTNPWHTVGASHFAGISVNPVSVAIDQRGTVYAAFADANNSYKANVWKYDGSWSQVGDANFSTAGSGAISLALTSTGTPYVAYVDAAHSNKMTVMRFDGSDWNTVGNAAFSASGVEGPSLALSASGVPYVAFIDVTSDYAPTVMKLNGSTWEMAGSALSQRGSTPTLVFDPDSGDPYLSFSNISDGFPDVFSFDGASWNSVGAAPPFVNLLGTVSIAFGSTGTLYMATADIGDNNYLRMFTFDGSTWNQLGKHYIGSTDGIVKIAVNASGTPYVAYTDYDTSVGSVITYNSSRSRWEQAGPLLFTSSTIGGMQLVVNPTNGGPYILYADNTASNYELTVMAYLPTAPGLVTGLSASWTTSPDSITLSWDSLNDTGGAAIEGYAVERKAPGETSYSTVTSNTGSTLPTYKDAFVRNGTFNYRVSAVNSVGVGTASTPVSITMVQDGGGSSVSVTPTATIENGPLAFVINDGAQTTTDQKITLGFNADPKTVRGYAASLDNTFANASIYPLDVTSFSLPSVPGTYTVYLKYYSTTGAFSPLLSQTVTYAPVKKHDVVTALAPTPVPTQAKKTVTFKRNLVVGSVGSDVKMLQQLLNSHGFAVAKTGVGSPGHETTLYGKLTAAAVIRFQEANIETILKPNGLKKGTGIFGPSTRSAVVKMMP